MPCSTNSKSQRSLSKPEPNSLKHTPKRGYPLSQKILLRTIEKTTEDREELLLNLSHATLSGGATIAPTIGKKVLESSLEVLAEEGILTEEEARILQVANTLIQTLDGASNADTILEIAKVASDTYKGLVECEIIKDESVSDRVKARIKSGDQVLNVLIMLDE